MNAVSQDLTKQFRAVEKVTIHAVVSLDKQIAWLSNLRDAMNAMTELVRKSIEEVETQAVTLDDPDETAAAMQRLTADRKAVPTIEPEPLWKRMARLMRGREKFTMTEAGVALERDMGKSLGPNRPQTVRNSLIRHAETFRQNDDKTFTVIGGHDSTPLEDDE